MLRSEKRTAVAIAFVVLASVGFGSISTLTTIVIRAGTPLISAMFWRYMVALVVMCAVVGITHRDRLVFSLKLLVIGGLSQAFLTYLSLSALNYISVAPLAFLFYTYPAWVTVVSAIRGLDRITPVRIIALISSLAGVAVIVGSPFESRLNVIGVALALGSAVTYGIMLPWVSEVQRGIDPMVAALHIAVGAAVAFGVGAIAQHAMTLPTSRDAIFGILMLALASTVGGFWLLLAGMARIGPVRTAIVATVEPFFTMLLGAMVLGDKLNARTAIGGALIATAVIVLQRASARVEESATPAAA